MNRTTNYKLCQWEADDKVQRTDFNADNAKLDAAIKAVAQRAAALETGKADKAQCLRIITGSFTGTGSADPVHISIGARPRLLLIATNNTIGNSNEKARFVTENGINIRFTHQNIPTVSFINPITFNDDGFTITFTESPDRSYNQAGCEQRYWVLV